LPNGQFCSVVCCFSSSSDGRPPTSRRRGAATVDAAPPASSLKETASTDSPSVQALVPEQALNKRDSVPVPFGRTDLDREILKETGGSAEGSGRDRLD